MSLDPVVNNYLHISSIYSTELDSLSGFPFLSEDEKIKTSWAIFLDEKIGNIFGRNFQEPKREKIFFGKLLGDLIGLLYNSHNTQKQSFLRENLSIWNNTDWNERPQIEGDFCWLFFALFSCFVFVVKKSCGEKISIDGKDQKEKLEIFINFEISEEKTGDDFHLEISREIFSALGGNLTFENSADFQNQKIKVEIPKKFSCQNLSGKFSPNFMRSFFLANLHASLGGLFEGLLKNCKKVDLFEIFKCLAENNEILSNLSLTIFYGEFFAQKISQIEIFRFDLFESAKKSLADNSPPGTAATNFDGEIEKQTPVEGDGVAFRHFFDVFFSNFFLHVKKCSLNFQNFSKEGENFYRLEILADRIEFFSKNSENFEKFLGNLKSENFENLEFFFLFHFLEFFQISFQFFHFKEKNQCKIEFLLPEKKENAFPVKRALSSVYHKMEREKSFTGKSSDNLDNRKSPAESQKILAPENPQNSQRDENFRILGEFFQLGEFHLEKDRKIYRVENLTIADRRKSFGENFKLPPLTAMGAATGAVGVAVGERKTIEKIEEKMPSPGTKTPRQKKLPGLDFGKIGGDEKNEIETVRDEIQKILKIAQGLNCEIFEILKIHTKRN